MRNFDENTMSMDGVGMPDELLLAQFGRIIKETFGEYCYVVGSALILKRDTRDIDVRLILDDADYERWCGPVADFGKSFGAWAGLCLAFSLLGKHLTGRRIDFQIQPQSLADRYDGARNAIGI